MGPVGTGASSQSISKLSRWNYVLVLVSMGCTGPKNQQQCLESKSLSQIDEVKAHCKSETCTSVRFRKFYKANDLLEIQHEENTRSSVNALS